MKQATLFLYLQKVTVSLGSWPSLSHFPSR